MAPQGGGELSRGPAPSRAAPLRGCLQARHHESRVSQFRSAAGRGAGPPSEQLPAVTRLPPLPAVG